jgi:hypothetical protein
MISEDIENNIKIGEKIIIIEIEKIISSNLLINL